MRTDASGAGSAFADPALYRCLLLSLFLHIGLITALGKNQPGQSSLPPGSSVVLRATLAHPQTGRPAISLPSGTSTVDLETPETGVTDTGKTDANALPSSGRKMPDVEERRPPGTPSPPSLNIIDTPQPHYYSQHELDIQPHVLEEPPEEPLARIARQKNGRAVLDLWINDLGRITGIELLESDLPDKFRDEVLRTFSKTIFSAGMKEGHAVHSQIRMELLFAPEPLQHPNERPKQAPQKLVPPHIR